MTFNEFKKFVLSTTDSPKVVTFRNGNDGDPSIHDGFYAWLTDKETWFDDTLSYAIFCSKKAEEFAIYGNGDTYRRIAHKLDVIYQWHSVHSQEEAAKLIRSIQEYWINRQEIKK